MRGAARKGGPYRNCWSGARVLVSDGVLPICMTSVTIQVGGSPGSGRGGGGRGWHPRVAVEELLEGVEAVDVLFGGGRQVAA